MSRFNRRDFLKLAAAGSAAGTLGLTGLARAQTGQGARVVVVGGGFGGATVAKYLRLADPSIQVTLVEPRTAFVTCPFSNLYLGGLRDMKSITHGYRVLRTRHGVTVVHDTVTDIEPASKRVRLKNDQTLSYDRLVLSPGIDFKWDFVKGYSRAAAQIMPHAWQAGPQTVLLKKQLQAMKNGSNFVMIAPPNPFRCPPGPYERASMVAHYLAKHKPRSKVIILDAKEAFSKQGLFMEGWAARYPGKIEWLPSSKTGTLASVNPRTMTIETQLEKFKAGVANVIPPQKAAAITHRAGLINDSGWCPVDPKTFESTIHPAIHVIGDASIAGALPKSGFAANSEAKICAHAIASMLRGDPVADASYVNTCYSLIAPDYGISIAGVYRVTDQGITEIKEPGAGGVSPKGAPASFRADEAKYTFGWYASITADIWG